MLARRMPFARVPCEIALPTFETDAFGNEVPAWDWDGSLETECSYAPGIYRTAATDDSFKPADPHGDDVTMTFYLPKELDCDLRGAILRVDVGGGAGPQDFHVVGAPHSYMRDATPGDMSWVVEGVLHLG